MSKFSLPPNGEMFIHTVKDRCIDLIKHDIWSGITQIEFNTWMKNFRTKNEKYFAACILDSLIYRCEKQEVALAMEIFTKKLPQYLNELSHTLFDYSDLLNILKNQVSEEHKIRLVTVANPQDRPGKSNDTVFRMYRRKLDFNDSWFIKPNEVEREIQNGITTFIFIDDFLGTGNQFGSMWNIEGFSLKLKDSNVMYCPLVAHVEGVNKLNNLNSDLKIIAGENLNEDCDVFKFAFIDGVNTTDGAKEFYKNMLEKYNFKNLLEENTFGYGNLGLAYTFSHASPDNCLQIIWEPQEGWEPLIKK